MNNNATPQRLYLMQLGTSTFPTDPPMPGSAGCYLIQTSDGKNILIDSGFPADSENSTGVSPAMTEKNVLAQLAELGLRPEDIDTLICTHFDIDHAGYHDAFTRAELIVQREHYELARSGHPRYAGARPHWDHPELRYRLIDGDRELIPGLTLIETSGHAPGHQSVLVRLPQTGPVLLVIDAVMFQCFFTPERKAWAFENEEPLRASTRKLLNLVECEHVALVVFGHDGLQWQTLKKAPAYYK
ncbi:N-acyl homoserine lactonase family protein [Dictyobacter arantiisoli]|uniref:N-acyl homoserine lactonase n=1 Tax=Dictyobacter arantiisoli TaxID=2014874 RepID=A0A5A5TFV1_9CHLR|nr:N-acyl homoserine lactonase family protein [Dictyobacter arantiisoli]GCF09933.1 N-acyl homoserine lactonase [Dictyobacter arantiisoli]